MPAQPEGRRPAGYVPAVGSAWDESWFETVRRLPRRDCEWLIEQLIAELDTRDGNADDEESEPAEENGDFEPVAEEAA